MVTINEQKPKGVWRVRMMSELKERQKRASVDTQKVADLVYEALPGENTQKKMISLLATLGFLSGVPVLGTALPVYFMAQDQR